MHNIRSIFSHILDLYNFVMYIYATNAIICENLYAYASTDFMLVLTLLFRYNMSTIVTRKAVLQEFLACHMIYLKI